MLVKGETEAEVVGVGVGVAAAAAAVAAAAAQSGDAIILVHGKKLLWPADRLDKRIHRHRPRHYASDIGHTSIG